MSTRDTAATTRKIHVFISGQKRGVFGVIKRELRRRSAIEPIIGHLKAEGQLGRCYLKGRAGDAANVVLSAVGHNFRRILAWLKELLCMFLASYRERSPVQPRSIQLLNGRLRCASAQRGVLP
jgi:IS5 family transposase